MIGIRTDANTTIATGHVMRCMTIADALCKLKKDVRFYVSDEESASYVRERGFECVVLNSNWEAPSEETGEFAKLLEEAGIESVLFDSYSFTAKYFEELRGRLSTHVRFAYMDDLGREVYPVDTLINYNAYAFEEGYSERYDDGVNLLLGPVYAPLRPQFTESYKRGFNIPMNVLVAAGGGNIDDIILDILEEAEKEPLLKEVDFHAVLGAMSHEQNNLMRLAFCCENIFIHRNVTDMAKLMSGCDAAISAAGTMLTELCCMKIPTVEYAIADNQLKNAAYYGKQGIMIAAGDIRENREIVIKRIVRELTELISDRRKLSDMRKKMEGICDGYGAGRIAEVLCS